MEVLLGQTEMEKKKTKVAAGQKIVTLLFHAFVSFLKCYSSILPITERNYVLLVLILHQLGIYSAPITSKKPGGGNRG